MTRPLLGIFVGGASTRMGGQPKGLLAANDTGESIVDRLLRIAGELSFEPAFVGQGDPYRARFPHVRFIDDQPVGVGPLGGLGGLLSASQQPVLAVACDMPYLSAPLLARLATTEPNALVLSSRTVSARWDPLCARYDPTYVRPALDAALADGVRSFQQLFARLTVTELVLDESERAQLVDWDTPEDLAR